MKLKILLALTCTLAAVQGFSQMKASSPTTFDDTSGIVIHADARLALVTKNHAPQPKTIYRSHRGYRVQIYNGNDRAKATQVKLDFMRRYPGVRTYLTYVQPQFRVKVGNYSTRAEAEKLYNQLSTLYSPCMIVNDIIEVNNAQKNDQ